MSRTLAGNLTGKAAQTALSEFREYLDETRPSTINKSHVMNICKQIHLLMGDNYLAWVESAPDDNAGFNAAAVAKLAELEAQEAQEINSVIEWIEGMTASPYIYGGEIVYPDDNSSQEMIF